MAPLRKGASSLTGEVTAAVERMTSHVQKPHPEDAGARYSVTSELWSIILRSELMPPGGLRHKQSWRRLFTVVKNFGRSFNTRHPQWVVIKRLFDWINCTVQSRNDEEDGKLMQQTSTSRGNEEG